MVPVTFQSDFEDVLEVISVSFSCHFGLSAPRVAQVLGRGASKAGPRRFFFDSRVLFGVHVGGLGGIYSDIL